ncbi:periplasmic nitrate reductase, NapE protein [Dongia sp. agr-C8]
MSGTEMMGSGRSRRRSEVLTFLFLTVFLAPILAVAIVGGYGFAVWMYQIIAGPPGS